MGSTSCVCHGSKISKATLIYLAGDVDPEAFSGDLPLTVDPDVPSESWIDKLKNLEHIYEVLTAYITVRCRRKLPLPSGEPDLKAVAQSQSEKDAIQLLRLVLLAAVFGRFSMDYIQQLTSFSEEAQAQFFMILNESEAVEEEADMSTLQPETSMSHDDGKPTIPTENGQGQEEFDYEERIARLFTVQEHLEHERDELKDQLEKMHDLHTKLQKSYDELEIQHRDTAERLVALRSGKGENSILGIQRTKMQQQETVIATLESQLNSLQDENNSLKAQAESLRSESEGYQQMQDDVFELKLEREKLQRTANAADKYKQKLESLHKVEEENEALKFRVTEMQRQLKQSDSDQLNISDLRQENREYQKLVANIEQALNDSNEAKKKAEFEKMNLAAQLQQADHQATRWHAKAEKLQTLLNEKSAPESPTTPRAPRSNGLDLVASEDDQTEQDSVLSKEMLEMQEDDQNVISEEELQAIISIMKAHNQSASNAERMSSIQEQQKLAAEIEKSRGSARETIQVIDILAQPRVEFVGVKDLDEGSPYKPVSPHIDDLASTYGVASQSARSSISSLSAVSRRSSVASFHSVQSTAKHRKGSSVLRGMFG